MRNLKDAVWLTIKAVLGTKNLERIRAFYNLRYFPSIDNPKTFNEKLMHQKLYADPKPHAHLADKYEVREVVKKVVGEEYLNKVYYAGDDLSNVEWDKLPSDFVVKGTHTGGGSGNIYVKDFQKSQIPDIITRAKDILKKRFGLSTNEDLYLYLKPRVMIEEFMDCGDGKVPADYKFFCFHGKCKFIQVDRDRFEGHTLSFYDTDWNYQDFSLAHYTSKDITPRPVLLSQMIEIAEKLANYLEELDFVRIDLYEYKGGIRFGEITLYPTSGWGPFNSKEADLKIGGYF